MRIQELQPGTEVTLEIKVKMERLEFKTTVIDQVRGVTILAPIRVDGKVLRLNAGSLSINMIYCENEKAPRIWKGIPLAFGTFKGETCYHCNVRTESITINRRNAYRLYIGMEGNAQIGTYKKPIRVTVKDISETGFSFVYEQRLQELRVTAGEPVHLFFDISGMHFNLQGRIVRMVEVDERRKLFGCKLIIPNPHIAKYIAEKQREKLAMEVGRKRDINIETVKNLEAEFEKNKKK